MVGDAVLVAADGVRAENQQSRARDRDVVGPLQIGLPLEHAKVWNAVDLACRVVVAPLHVEVVPAVGAALRRLATGFGEAVSASDHLEVELRQGLDSAPGVEDRLDDEGPMATGAPARQRLAEVVGADEPLLHAGQDDRPGPPLGIPW